MANFGYLLNLVLPNLDRSRRQLSNDTKIVKFGQNLVQKFLISQILWVLGRECIWSQQRAEAVTAAESQQVLRAAAESLQAAKNLEFSHLARMAREKKKAEQMKQFQENQEAWESGALTDPLDRMVELEWFREIIFLKSQDLFKVINPFEPFRECSRPMFQRWESWQKKPAGYLEKEQAGTLVQFITPREFRQHLAGQVLPPEYVDLAGKHDETNIVSGDGSTRRAALVRPENQFLLAPFDTADLGGMRWLFEEVFFSSRQLFQWAFFLHKKVRESWTQDKKVGFAHCCGEDGSRRRGVSYGKWLWVPHVRTRHDGRARQKRDASRPRAADGLTSRHRKIGRA